MSTVTLSPVLGWSACRHAQEIVATKLSASALLSSRAVTVARRALPVRALASWTCCTSPTNRMGATYQSVRCSTRVTDTFIGGALLSGSETAPPRRSTVHCSPGSTFQSRTTQELGQPSGSRPRGVKNYTTMWPKLVQPLVCLVRIAHCAVHVAHCTICNVENDVGMMWEYARKYSCTRITAGQRARTNRRLSPVVAASHAGWDCYIGCQDSTTDVVLLERSRNAADRRRASPDGRAASPTVASQEPLTMTNWSGRCTTAMPT